MNPARVLVTGASGLVGREVCARLLADGISVIAPRHRREPPPGTNGIVHSLGDRASLASAMAGIDAVVHAAARFEGDDLEAVNVDFTDALVAAANTARVPRFVFLSSAMVYAAGAFSCADESHPIDPQDPYGRSKFEAERILFERFGGASTSLRPASIYGDDGGRIVESARAMIGLPALPASSVPIDIVHVGDVADAVVLALRSPTLAPAYNVTGPTKAAFDDLARAVAAALGIAITFVELDRWIDTAPAPLVAAATIERTLSNDRAWRDLGYRPSRDWREWFTRAWGGGNS